MLSHRCAQCLVYGGGAGKVEETGELRRWSLERPSPGPAAARRRRGAVGEASPNQWPCTLKVMQCWRWRSLRWGSIC